MTLPVVTRNWGDGFVAATIPEGAAGAQPWILSEPLARELGFAIPAPVTTHAWKPELLERAGEVAMSMRTPFWRRMPRTKRGRRRG